MVLQKYILPIPFFISLFIGFFMCYILTPPPQIVCRHPTPDNLDTIYDNEDGGGVINMKLIKLNVLKIKI